MAEKPTYGRRRSTGPRTRAFIGIELPKELKEKILKTQEQIQKSTKLPLDLEAPDNLHVHLVYLGHIAQERLSAAYKVVREAAREFVPFEVKVGPLGYFYSGEKRDHSVVILEIKDRERNLQSLFRQITNALSTEEFSPPHRLIPNVQIAQLKKQRDRNVQTKMLETLIEQDIDEDVLTVGQVTFFEEQRGGSIKPLERILIGNF